MQIFKSVIATAALVLSVSCSNKTNQYKTVLAVSIEPQRQILEQLAGPGFDVVTILGQGADPENFDPSTSQRLALDNADIYFPTGVLPFEKTLKESLGSNTAYVPTIGETELIYGNHGHDHGTEACGHHHEMAVEGAGNIASIMYKTLSEEYPDIKDGLTERYTQFNDSLAELRDKVSETLGKAKRRTFAVWHPSLSYFAREFALEQLPLGVEGKDLSAKALAEAIDHAKADSVEVFFFQPGIDSRQAEIMSQGIGSRLVSVNLLDYFWQDQLKLIADEIAGAQ